MDYKYTYLTIALMFFLVWIILFLFRKNVRKEMLFMSLLFGIAGLFVEPVYVLDWWKPLTITNTIVGIEDFLFGFAFGGTAAVIYEEIFKKKLRLRKGGKKIRRQEDFHFLLVAALVVGLFFGGHLFGLNTFQSTLLAFITGLAVIYIQRKDLIIDSLATGIISLVTAIIIYALANLIFPGWIDQFLYFVNIPRFILISVPLEDAIWYFITGAFIGPLYEFWKEGKLVKA